MRRTIHVTTPFHFPKLRMSTPPWAYAAMRSPVSDPLARYENAEKLKRDSMMKNHTLFFNPWDTIHESNPQEILDRHEEITLVPF